MMNGSNRKNNHVSAPKSMRLWFGIFMVLIYVGMGSLCIMNVFQLGNEIVAISVGVLLIIYGLFRGYRLYKSES